MIPFRRAPALVIPALVLAGVAPGSARAAAPLYTNEDLDRLAPLPVQAVPAVRDSPDDWRFVLEMLDREHRRLDAERMLQLARDRQTLLEKTQEDRGREVVLYPLWWGGSRSLRACALRPTFVRPRPAVPHAPPAR